MQMLLKRSGLRFREFLKTPYSLDMLSN